MAARSIGSGTISFGLVSIPFKLYTATSAKSVSFNMLHKGCGSRLKQQLVCSLENVVVERSDTVKGFEHQKDQYVTFTEEELKGMEAARTGALELQEFVPASSVDFLYIEKTYFIGPDKGGDRAYRLLSEALTRNDKLAVGRFAQRGKDNLVIIRPYKKGLILHEAYYADEVRSFDDVDTGATFEFKDLELDLADKLIEQLERDEFDPARFKDEWAEKVLAAVNQKVAGEEVTAAPEAPKAQIIDLLEALKRSVALAANTTKPESVAPKPPKKAEVREEEAPAAAAASAPKGKKKKSG
ncbi:MAG: Ku protein [Labilithrix sp.]